MRRFLIKLNTALWIIVSIFAWRIMASGVNGILSSALLYEPEFGQGRPVEAETREDSEIIRRASPAVVKIVSYKETPVMQEENWEPWMIIQSVSSGSGFFITSNGYIVTNKHVVQDEDVEYMVKTEEYPILNARVVYRDPEYDLAILKVRGDDFPVLELGDSSDIKIGERVIGIGNSEGGMDTVSLGEISGIYRNIKIRNEDSGEPEILRQLIKITAKLRPGDSGGPLLNSEGKVIGVNVATTAGKSDSYSIPVWLARQVAKKAGVDI